jgi:hypothetical protein
MRYEFALLASNLKCHLLQLLGAASALQLSLASKSTLHASFEEALSFAKGRAASWQSILALLKRLQSNVRLVPCVTGWNAALIYAPLSWRSKGTLDHHLAAAWSLDPASLVDIQQGRGFWEFVLDDQAWLLSWQRYSGEDVHSHPCWCILHASKHFRVRYCKPCDQKEHSDAVVVYFVHRDIEISLLLRNKSSREL